jgi:hypothetical protein
MRQYSHTAWLMGSPGTRWRLESDTDGCTAETYGTVSPARHRRAVTIPMVKQPASDACARPTPAAS